MPIPPSLSFNLSAKASPSSLTPDSESANGHDPDSDSDSSDWALASFAFSASVGDGSVGAEMQTDLEAHHEFARLVPAPQARPRSSTATFMTESVLPDREIAGDVDRMMGSRDDDGVGIAPLRWPENEAAPFPYEQGSGLDAAATFGAVRLDGGATLEHDAYLDNSLSSEITEASESSFELISYFSDETRSVEEFTWGGLQAAAGSGRVQGESVLRGDVDAIGRMLLQYPGASAEGEVVASFDALVRTVTTEREVYFRLRDQATRAELAARQAYRMLIQPRNLQSAMVDPIRLHSAREAARVAARTHSEAEEAVRALRATYSGIASASLAWASGDTNAQFALLSRGTHALRAIEMLLLSEAQHRFMGAIFHGASTMNDPVQPLPPESLVLFDDWDELEHAMNNASQPIPVFQQRVEVIQGVATGARTLEQIRAAARAANDAGNLQASSRRTTLSLDRVYRTAQLRMEQTNDLVLAPLREHLEEQDEIFRLVQLETVGAAEAALQVDVPLTLRQALAEFMPSALSTAALSAQTYVRDLEHLIRLAVAAPMGAITGLPSHLRGPELLSHVNTWEDEALDPSLAQGWALWSLADIFHMVDEMASAWLSVQSIAAFRFKGVPDSSSDDR